MPSLLSLAASERCQFLRGFVQVLDAHGVTQLDAEAMRWLLGAVAVVGGATVADSSQVIGKIEVDHVGPEKPVAENTDDVIGPTRPTPTTVGPVGQVGLLAKKTDPKKDQPDKPAVQPTEGGESNDDVRDAIRRSLASVADQPLAESQLWDDELDEDQQPEIPPPTTRKPAQRVTQRRPVRPSSVWFYGRRLTEHDAQEILEQLLPDPPRALLEEFWCRLAREDVGSGEAGYVLFEHQRQFVKRYRSLASPIGWFFTVLHNQQQAHGRVAA